MEQPYILWRTGSGLLTALVTFPLAFLLSAGAFILLRGHPWLQLPAVVLVCWPLIVLPFRADKRHLPKNTRT
jgi:hypothetical protein